MMIHFHSKTKFCFYHPIKLKDENAVAYRKPYKVPLRYAEELQRQLKKYLEAGFIEPSVSPLVLLWLWYQRQTVKLDFAMILEG